MVADKDVLGFEVVICETSLVNLFEDVNKTDSKLVNCLLAEGTQGIAKVVLHIMAKLVHNEERFRLLVARIVNLIKLFVVLDANDVFASVTGINKQQPFVDASWKVIIRVFTLVFLIMISQLD